MDQFDPVAVGDLSSDAKGTGARRNGAKVPVDLIPLRLIYESLLKGGRHWFEPEMKSLLTLARFQERTASPESLADIAAAFGPGVWIDCAKVFDYGRRKYAAWNWAKGMPWSVPLGCAARHLLAMLGVPGFTAGESGAPERDDPESGLPHRGHVICNVVMLQVYCNAYLEGDDRAPKGYLALTTLQD